MAMSGRILSHRLGPLLRRGLLARQVHNVSTRTGGLLRSDGSAALRGRAWPVGANSIHNNVSTVRAISFARILPKLALKLARVPAMFGGAMIAGLAYIQYQANRKSLKEVSNLMVIINCSLLTVLQRQETTR